jgi:thiol-disulfide isomerase/thioredoxin
MSKQIYWSIALLLTSAALGAFGKELNVGEPAPKLEVKEFIKGKAVSGLEKGKIYVVEFWATWCGPCKATIPHLTELQKKHKDVTFIGVSVYEREPAGVKPFVEEMKDKMGYRVATDLIPDGGRPESGKMAQNWLEAAGQEGIPTAFIVNADGKVAWIGHPAEMEVPLEEILSGKWNLKLAADTFKIMKKITQAQRSGDTKTMLAALDEGITLQPAMEPQFGMVKFQVLASRADSQDKALKYGQHLVKSVVKDDAGLLNNVAWLILSPEAKKPEAQFVKLALQAAQRADELAHGKDPIVADILARAYFLSGNAGKALETQERAIKLSEGGELEKDPGMKDRLAEYQKAAKKGG